MLYIAKGLLLYCMKLTPSSHFKPLGQYIYLNKINQYNTSSKTTFAYGSPDGFFLFVCFVFTSSEPPGLQALHKALWSIDYYDAVCDVYITLEVQLVKNFV